MYSSTKPVGSYFPPVPPAPASANYPFLANPPKHKHKPQPITVRCLPTRTLARPTPSRRRTSGSGSPASFIAFVDTPTPTLDTPKTPHLTTHGYTAAFSTLYHRRGSLPETPRSARRFPTSPKRSPRRSPPSSPKRGSPRRRQHRVPSPSSPFAPPSPTRIPQGRPRAKSTTTRIPIPATPPPPPRTPKLSKIRSFTNLRSHSPSPAPSMSTTVSTSSSKRAKRSATPARGSETYAKYRPMPFIQQMQMIQFLEGGSLDSHIRRHHVQAGQGTAGTGFAGHGYAFTDEQGMVWFDEEEEWEFACLLPRKLEPRRKGGLKRFLGKRRGQESEDEWEQFMEEEEPQGDVEEVDVDVLLAKEDDELLAGQDDLAAFGGQLEGAWGRERPERSVLNLPKPKREKGTRRRRARRGSIRPATAPAPAAAPAPAPTTALKQEFLGTAFAPPATRPSSSLAVPPAPTRSASPFRRFKHNRNRSVPNVGPNVGEGQSFASLGATMRGGSVLDADVPSSPGLSMSFSRDSSPDPRVRSVSPPLAAARRLGIDPSSTVSLQPSRAAPKKPSFMNMRRRRD